MAMGKQKEKVKHHVYMLRCNDGSLYTGYAINPKKRLAEHNGESLVPGARYTRGRRPVQLVYVESFTTRSLAMQREAAIKQLSRAEKEALIIS